MPALARTALINFRQGLLLAIRLMPMAEGADESRQGRKNKNHAQWPEPGDPGYDGQHENVYDHDGYGQPIANGMVDLVVHLTLPAINGPRLGGPESLP